MRLSRRACVRDARRPRQTACTAPPLNERCARTQAARDSLILSVAPLYGGNGSAVGSYALPHRTAYKSLSLCVCVCIFLCSSHSRADVRRGPPRTALFATSISASSGVRNRGVSEYAAVASLSPRPYQEDAKGKDGAAATRTKSARVVSSVKH